MTPTRLPPGADPHSALRRPPTPARGRLLALLPLLPLLLLTAGCGLLQPKPPVAREPLERTARFYWPYAALATDVYRTRGVTDSHTAMALASPWLREQVLALKDESERSVALDRLESIRFPEADQLYRARLEQRCQEELRHHGLAATDPVSPPSCVAAADARSDEQRVSKDQGDEPNEFIGEEPLEPEDCAYNAGHKPRVPVNRVSDGAQGWTRVPELQKQTAARAWRFFVPELAIDVWRRTRSAPEERPDIEYAIVYRGTVGGGGWISNLRGLTAMLPFVWDQYRQADIATDAIIDQIDRLHTLADSLLGRAEPTRLRFTAVGHSLGGGLAQYIYLRTPRVTRVVAFDPSPIDGASLIPVERRAAYTAAGVRAVDLDPRDDQAAIHLLHEKGEFISVLAPCRDGPVWGDEGGPRVRCDRVNFVHGNTFRQHNMAQLACHLYLAQQHKPPQPAAASGAAPTPTAMRETR